MHKNFCNNYAYSLRVATIMLTPYCDISKIVSSTIRRVSTTKREKKKHTLFHEKNTQRTTQFQQYKDLK
jgi:hypothetical protein